MDRKSCLYMGVMLHYFNVGKIRSRQHMSHRSGGVVMIEVNHISKDFVSQKKYPGLKGAVKGLFSAEKTVKKAVDDISFTIQDGEIVGYIGSNGAGKSTTIKMMTGILTPTRGECLVNGVNPSKNRKENAQNIGVVFGQRT